METDSNATHFDNPFDVFDLVLDDSQVCQDLIDQALDGDLAFNLDVGIHKGSLVPGISADITHIKVL